MSSIGIIGGMGPQASNLLLSLLIENSHKFTTIKSDEDFPDIVLLNVPVPNFTQNKSNQAKALEILKTKLPILESAGTKVNAIACNTAHLLLPELEQESGLVFLNMPKLTIEEATKSGAKRVGLFGSETTMRSDLYDQMPPGAVLVKPSQKQQDKINQLIMRQIQGNITSSDRKAAKRLIDTFVTNQSLDVVILGCTELPVIVGGSHPKTVSSLHVLADKLLEECFMQS